MKQTSIVYKFSLAFIVLFSLFLYLYKITVVPVSLFSDEADANYQAFIFNQRHTDYFGNKYPIHFHSYSDWRTSLYIYSVALTQKIIGHTDLAARMPAAIYGSLSVLIFCLIIKLLLKNEFWSIVGGFLFSITPWLFIYSRAGFEATGMLLFLLLGIYFWIKFINQKKYKYIYLSAGSFLLTMYFYSTAKLFLLFIAVTMLIIWFKEIWQLSFKSKFILFLIILFISLPFAVDLFKGRAGYRFSYISIFSDPVVSKTVDNLRQEDSLLIYGPQLGLKTPLFSKIFYNKPFQWVEMLTKNYFSAFSTDFLFINGDDNLRQGIGTVGNLYILDFFFIIIGIASLFSKKESNNFYLFFLFSLILAPLPFALTRDSIGPHSTRLILMLPFLSFFSLLGLKQFLKIIKSKFFLRFILFIYIILFVSFLHQYFFHYPNISAKSWHYGMKDIVNKSNNLSFSKIFFIGNESFVPFFLNYNEFLPSETTKSPSEVLKEENNISFTGMQIDSRYYFGHMEWSSLLNQMPSDSIFAVPELELIRARLSVEDYNKSHSNSFKINQVYELETKYSFQEKFYLITFNQ